MPFMMPFMMFETLAILRNLAINVVICISQVSAVAAFAKSNVAVSTYHSLAKVRLWDLNAETYAPITQSSILELGCVEKLSPSSAKLWRAALMQTRPAIKSKFDELRVRGALLIDGERYYLDKNLTIRYIEKDRIFSNKKLESEVRELIFGSLRHTCPYLIHEPNKHKR